MPRRREPVGKNFAAALASLTILAAISLVLVFLDGGSNAFLDTVAGSLITATVVLAVGRASE